VDNPSSDEVDDCVQAPEDKDVFVHRHHLLASANLLHGFLSFPYVENTLMRTKHVFCYVKWGGKRKKTPIRGDFSIYMEKYMCSDALNSTHEGVY